MLAVADIVGACCGCEMFLLHKQVAAWFSAKPGNPCVIVQEQHHGQYVLERAALPLQTSKKIVVPKIN